MYLMQINSTFLLDLKHFKHFKHLAPLLFYNIKEKVFVEIYFKTAFAKLNPREIFRMPEFAKLNPREIFEKTRFAKYDFFDLAKLNPRENLSD